MQRQTTRGLPFSYYKSYYELQKITFITVSILLTAEVIFFHLKMISSL